MFYKSLCRSLRDKTGFVAFNLKHFCDMKSKSSQPKHVDVKCVRAECHLCVFTPHLSDTLTAQKVSLLHFAQSTQQTKRRFPCLNSAQVSS